MYSILSPRFPRLVPEPSEAPPHGSELRVASRVGGGKIQKYDKI